MKTADYLAQLVKDVETVRTKLDSQGVITEPTETLTTLAPKIGNIGDDLGTVVYMRLFDLPDVILHQRPYIDVFYNENSVKMTDDLINALGGV